MNIIDLNDLLYEMYQYLPSPQAPLVLTATQLSADLKIFDYKFLALINKLHEEIILQEGIKGNKV